MYRCDECDQVIPAHNQSHRKVVETRDKTYPARKRANKFHRTANYEQIYRKTLPWPEEWEKDGLYTYTDDRGGTGQEVAKEIRVCPSCKVEPIVHANSVGSPPHLVLDHDVGRARE